MKRHCWVLILLLISLPALAPRTLAYREQVVEAWQVTDAIVIDGKLEDWNLSSPIVLDRAEQVFRDANQWFGETDLSARIYVMWDDANLYIAAEINDDTPFMYREGFPPDMADSIVLYFGTDSASDPNRASYVSSDFRVVLILDDYYFNTAIDREMVEDKAGITTIGDYGDEQALEGYEAAINAVGKEVYVFEAKIPWSNFASEELPLIKISDGLEIGFNVEMNDLDFPCPGVATPGISWIGSGQSSTDPSHWGKLIFKTGGK